MIQEIKMPVSLKTPRPGRAEQLRALVEVPPQNSKPKKLWLLKNTTIYHEGGFTNQYSPFQSSLNDPNKRNTDYSKELVTCSVLVNIATVISNPTPIATVQQDNGLTKPKSNGWLINKTENDQDPRNQRITTQSLVSVCSCR
uniref:CSON013025 protein n=1 Tax=Culicoides sonorensis TaxID=179676 RepID=A0A336M6U0_CULSO